MKILALGLVIIGFGLMFWFIRLCRGMRAEYRPPFGVAGPFEFLRLDYYSDKGRTTIAKALCVLALLSFVMVLFSLLMGRLSPPDQAVRPGKPALPADFFFHTASAMFFVTAQLGGFVLLLAAGVQFAWGMLSPPAKALRPNAVRYAVYGVGALLVAIAHAVLLQLGPGLLK